MSHVDYYPSLPHKRRRKMAPTDNADDRLSRFQRHIAMIRGTDSSDMVVDLLNSIAMEITTNRMSSEDAGHLLSCIMAELQLRNCRTASPECLAKFGLTPHFLANLRNHQFSAAEDE